MKGFRVSWRIYQDKENYTNYGWPGQPNPFPLIHGGKYLTTFRSDADKLERTGGTGGVVLGKSGATSIHLYPPVEKHPGKGAILYGNVKVVAVLNSKDNPSVFGITDPISFKEWAEKEAEEIPKEAYRWAVLKTLSNAIKVLKDVGLPNRAVNITVSYHGNDIYTVKGDTNLWLFYVALPISLDMYTCDGLRNGVWKGKGGIKKWDVTVYGDLLASIVGDKIPHNVSNWNDHLKIPLSPSDDNLSVWQYSPFDIAPDFKLQGLMTITSPPREQFAQVEGNRKVAEQHQNGVVGNVLLVMNGQSLDRLALLLGGLSTAKYPVVGVKSYPKCKGGGPDDYYYENR